VLSECVAIARQVELSKIVLDASLEWSKNCLRVRRVSVEPGRQYMTWAPDGPANDETPDMDRGLSAGDLVNLLSRILGLR
jgi:hypothetical protein